MWTKAGRDMRTISRNVSVIALINPGNWLGAVTATLLRMDDRVRQRRALAALDDRLLKDVGLSRADVERECTRPFWR
jgi:uncharacterized protein YjiS (DUF1127 family)